MFGYWPSSPIYGESAVLGAIPCMWWGITDRDGDATPWKEVPAGSLYLYMNSTTPKVYIKDADNKHDNDWGTVDIA